MQLSWVLVGIFVRKACSVARLLREVRSAAFIRFLVFLEEELRSTYFEA